MKKNSNNACNNLLGDSQKNVQKNAQKGRGFTMIEMLVVIALSVFVIGLTASAFVGLSNNQSLDKDVGSVTSVIQKARANSLNAKNGSEHGVKFATSSITLFEGTVYNSSATSNVVYNISSKVVMSQIQLTGGASSLYFQQINGKPSATGTIMYRLNADASSTKSILIYGSGLIEMQ